MALLPPQTRIRKGGLAKEDSNTSTSALNRMMTKSISKIFPLCSQTQASQLLVICVQLPRHDRAHDACCNLVVVVSLPPGQLMVARNAISILNSRPMTFV